MSVPEVCEGNMKPQCLYQAYLVSGPHSKWCNLHGEDCKGFDECKDYEEKKLDDTNYKD